MSDWDSLEVNRSKNNIMKKSKSVLNLKNKKIRIILGILVLYFLGILLGGNMFKDTSDACKCSDIFIGASLATSTFDYPEGYWACKEKYGYPSKAGEYCRKNNKK